MAFALKYSFPRAFQLSLPKLRVAIPFQQTRGIKTIDFAGTKETVYGASGILHSDSSD